MGGSTGPLPIQRAACPGPTCPHHARMAVPVVVAAFVVLFWGASALAERLRRGAQWVPHALLAALAFVLFFEITRYDQGYPELLTWIGFLVAPVLAIFGGAAWGSRRLYGWPDLGPMPSRIALVAAAVLVGVLLGMRQKPDDIRESENALKGWVQAGAQGDPPATKLGFLAPPIAEKGVDAKAGATWGFPVGNHHWRVLHVTDMSWHTVQVQPRKERSP